jgi:hypothetical protein
VTAVLKNAKAIAAFVGAIATALLTVYVGNPILTTISVVATAVATYAIPNTEAE